jgi:hypothetical protein
MDIKLETTGNWPIKTEKRARKTTRGEAYTTVTAYARVVFVGSDPDTILRRSSIGSQLEASLGLPYLPDSMKQWVGLRAEVAITSGGRFRSNGVECFDFGFKMTKRGRGHANFGKQFTALLSQLDQEGTLQEIAKRIVEDELTRVERAASDEAKRRRLESVAAFIVSSVKEQAEIVLDYRIKLDALRKTRLDKMDELCTDDLLDQLAAEHSLPLDTLKDEVAQRLVHRPLSFSLGD